MILIAGAIIYLPFKQRIERSQKAREVEILSTYSLLRNAVARNDEELFVSLLDDSNKRWFEIQQNLFDIKWNFGGRFLGDYAHQQGFNVNEVILSPDLTSAEVVSEEHYGIREANGSTKVGQFYRSDFFHKDGGWQWSRPMDDYWGERVQISSSSAHLVMDLPARDGEVGARLLEDLDELIVRLCYRESALRCPDDLILQLKLSDDSAAILELGEEIYNSGYGVDRLHKSADGYTMNLPAPSLVGIPSAEAGYQVLLRSYSRHVTAALATSFVDSECCESEAYYYASLRAYVDNDGLLAPITAVDEKINQDFPAVEYDVEVMCSNGFYQGVSRHRLDMANGLWRRMTQSPDNATMMAEPSGNGIFVQESVADVDGVSISINWFDDDEGFVVIERLFSPRFANRFAWSVAEKENLLIVRVPDEDLALDTYYTYDVSSCDVFNCTPMAVELQGYPIWSPDGSQLIVRGYRRLWLITGDELQEEMPLGEGQSPFWIDNDTFGYIRGIGVSQWEAVIFDIQEDDDRRAFIESDLEDALPSEERPARMTVAIIIPDGAKGNRWWVVAIGRQYRELKEKAYIFEYNMTDDRLALVTSSEGLNGIDFSLAGHFLAGRSYDETENKWTYAIYDLGKGQIGNLDLNSEGMKLQRPTSDWSPDGRWLLAMERDILYLYNQQSDLGHAVKAPQQGCFQAAWVNQ